MDGLKEVRGLDRSRREDPVGVRRSRWNSVLTSWTIGPGPPRREYTLVIRKVVGFLVAVWNKISTTSPGSSASPKGRSCFLLGSEGEGGVG